MFDRYHKSCFFDLNHIKHEVSIPGEFEYLYLENEDTYLVLFEASNPDNAFVCFNFPLGKTKSKYLNSAQNMLESELHLDFPPVDSPINIQEVKHQFLTCILDEIYNKGGLHYYITKHFGHHETQQYNDWLNKWHLKDILTLCNH